MNESAASSERRRHKRFLPRENAYAVLTPGYKQLGIINNISRGGLSYRYISNGESDTGDRYMDIFLTDKAFYLKQIPFATVSISESDRLRSVRAVAMKQRSVRFSRLDLWQKNQLRFFLSQHTLEIRSVKDRRQVDDNACPGPERRKNRERRKGLLWS